MKTHRIIITGGHITPAFAVIERLLALKKWQILVITRKHARSRESVLAPEIYQLQAKNIPFRTISVSKINPPIDPLQMLNLVKPVLGLAQSLRLIRAFRPQVCLSFGSYVAIPVCLAAKISNLYLITHEQASIAGLSNRFIAKLADKIAVSWPENLNQFPAQKTILTGNPLRQSIYRPSLFINPSLRIQQEEKLPLLYLTGGSQGSVFLNQLIGTSLNHLSQRYRLFIQTGRSHHHQSFAQLNLIKNNLSTQQKNRIQIKEWYDAEEIGWLLHHADLVVSRAGANSITEIAAAGTPCLLIPLPISRHQEQLKNAQILASIGLAKLINQADLTPPVFCRQLSQMIRSRQRYLKHQAEAQRLVPLDAADRIISLLTPS